MAEIVRSVDGTYEVKLILSRVKMSILQDESARTEKPVVELIDEAMDLCIKAVVITSSAAEVSRKLSEMDNTQE